MLDLFKYPFKDQKGNYLWFFLIAAVVFVGFFFMQIPYSPSSTGKAPGGVTGKVETCMHNPPLETNFFVDEGETFVLLKEQAPILGVQADLHMHIAKTLTVNGKERKVSRTDRQSDISNWFIGDPTEDPLFLNLRYVNVTEDVSNRPPGTQFIDIYIKKGAQIPSVILKFCEQNSVNWKAFQADNLDKSFPPKEIDAAQIAPWQCTGNCDPGADSSNAPTDGKYYLYAYDRDSNAPVDYVKSRQVMPVSTITIEGVAYSIVYYGGWESKHLRLETVDPLDGSPIGFRYANPSRLKVPEDAYKFLNTGSTDQSTLQIQTFNPFQIPMAGWWTPECKPAIYLYPKNTMQVNVKVSPQGLFTYTDPIYDADRGWNVRAYPSGKLEWLDGFVGKNSKGELRSTNNYEYLYYESKIHDSMIEKPTEGFVVAYEDLEQFYRTTLPKLGLNQKETEDYISYWLNVLPKAEFYFVGVLAEENVDQIEPMRITPLPDSVLRVRLYYEALSDEEATLRKDGLHSPLLDSLFKREGFSVVEWGGMVKQDKDHPFTCSM